MPCLKRMHRATTSNRPATIIPSPCGHAYGPRPNQNQRPTLHQRSQSLRSQTCSAAIATCIAIAQRLQGQPTTLQRFHCREHRGRALHKLQGFESSRSADGGGHNILSSCMELHTQQQHIVILCRVSFMPSQQCKRQQAVCLNSPSVSIRFCIHPNLKAWLPYEHPVLQRMCT